MTKLGRNRVFQCIHCRANLQTWNYASYSDYGRKLAWSDGAYRDLASHNNGPSFLQKCPICQKAFFVADTYGGFISTLIDKFLQTPQAPPLQNAEDSLIYDNIPWSKDADVPSMDVLINSTRSKTRRKVLLLEKWQTQNDRLLRGIFIRHEFTKQNYELCQTNKINNFTVTNSRETKRPIMPPLETPQQTEERYNIYEKQQETLAINAQNSIFADNYYQDFVNENIDTMTNLVKVLPNDRGFEQIIRADALRQLGRFSSCIDILKDLRPELNWKSEKIRSWAEASDLRLRPFI